MTDIPAPDQPHDDSSQPEALQRFTVLDDDGGSRLDAALAKRFPEFSRSSLSTLIDEGKVRVAGVLPKKTKRSLKLEPGMEVSLTLPDPAPRELAGNPELQAEILYEDEAIVAFAKPAGMVVHPQKIDATDTLANLLVARYGAGLPSADEAGLMPGVVHRLDADTSGVMVCARTPEALSELKRQFREREVVKHYVAVVQGNERGIKPEFTIDSPLERDPGRGNAMRINKEQGRPATTRFVRRQKLDGYAILDAWPETGRTHQIRVHLASRGWPVVADHLYSPSNELRLSEIMREGDPVKGDRVIMARQALHAFSLTITHPTSGERVTFEAPLPDDMEALLMALRIHRLG